MDKIWEYHKEGGGGVAMCQSYNGRSKQIMTKFDGAMVKVIYSKSFNEITGYWVSFSFSFDWKSIVYNFGIQLLI